MEGRERESEALVMSGFLSGTSDRTSCVFDAARLGRMVHELSPVAHLFHPVLNWASGHTRVRAYVHASVFL